MYKVLKPALSSAIYNRYTEIKGVIAISKMRDGCHFPGGEGYVLSLKEKLDCHRHFSETEMYNGVDENLAVGFNSPLIEVLKSSLVAEVRQKNSHKKRYKRLAMKMFLRACMVR